MAAIEQRRRPRSIAARAYRKCDEAFRVATARLRALPDFLILGAMRAGTTGFFRYIIQHPMVVPPLGKELHYFDMHYSRGELWLRSRFPLRATMAFWSRIRGQRHITGSGTPYYLFHPLAPKRAKDTVPEARLIVMLRNPIDRALSHYQHSFKLGHETLPIMDALEAEERRLAGEAERLCKEPTYVSIAHRRFAYKGRSVYID